MEVRPPVEELLLPKSERERHDRDAVPLDELGGPDSSTETFVALKAEIDNWRWGGVPFYLRTGKRIPIRASEIVIQFKPVPHSIFDGGARGDIQANRLVIELQPDEDQRNAVAALDRLYAAYPRDDARPADATVRLFAARPWRRASLRIVLWWLPSRQSFASALMLPPTRSGTWQRRPMLPSPSWRSSILSRSKPPGV